MGWPVQSTLKELLENKDIREAIFVPGSEDAATANLQYIRENLPNEPSDPLQLATQLSDLYTYFNKPEGGLISTVLLTLCKIHFCFKLIMQHC